jgi:RecB family exonuclease
MKERPLSASSTKTYLQCALKYYFRYELDKPRVDRSDATVFGTAVHSGLEELYKIVSRTGQKPTDEDYKAVLDAFMKSATKNGLGDQALYQEGRDMLRARTDNADPEEKILGLELKFSLKTPKGTPFGGSIDKLVELDPETVAVIDYKTSRMALTQEEADDDVQLSMYDLAVSMLYPQYKTIVCGLDYLRLSPVVSHRSPEQRALFVEFLDNVYANVLEEDATTVKPSLNNFCGYCEFRQYCDLYKRVIDDADIILPRLDSLGDEDFVEAWDKVENARRVVDNRYREFKDEVYARMNRQETVKGKSMEIYKVQNGRQVYDSRAVFNIIGGDHFSKIASISKQGVDKHVMNNPHHAEKIEGVASFAFSSPSFRTRKRRG